MKFLNKIIDTLLDETQDLASYKIILPGKRPIVFIKDILKNQKKYAGFLPEFFTIEDLISEIAGQQAIKGVALWLFGYNVYKNIYPSEDFGQFLKWFPTLLKDWDDMLKFSQDEMAVIQYMFDEERIKNWGERLGTEQGVQKRHLDFWRKMKVFLPQLKSTLLAQGYATSGMIHQQARERIVDFVSHTDGRYIFCGFNALTPVEELLIKNLLEADKAQCFFQADSYYIDDTRQEAGQFLREYKNWQIFNDHRPFSWIEGDFIKPKNIKVYEVAGNVTQTQVLPNIFKNYNPQDYSDTALVLLDENLLPATLEVLSEVPQLNITMGLPIKNLSFSTAMKHIFYVQNQLSKGKKSYYHHDVITILEALPQTIEEVQTIQAFKSYITEHNIVYISPYLLKEYLGRLEFYSLFEPQDTISLLDQLISYCYQLKFRDLDDIQYETVAYFEKNFRIIKNQIEPYQFDIIVDNLETLMAQMLGAESIDFKGEPLAGLQVMGLLETRLLNFKNIILLSTNEGKLPLGNTQNTYLPFDVRAQFNLNTFIENDGIYAYHFYRLLQEAESIHLLYNGLSTGVNTGEKSRFIEQIKIESPHRLEQVIIENPSEPIERELMSFDKSPLVMQRLEEWKQAVAASHLLTYIYNPVDFYMKVVLRIKETEEIEEELSVRNYGNLVHYALQYLYERLKGRILSISDLEIAFTQIDDSIDYAIKTLKHQPEFYQRGMNFVHQMMAKKVLAEILRVDMNLLKAGHTLEIIELERKIEHIPFRIDEKTTVYFKGFIDRIDRLDGKLRVIDYKTAKAKKLNLKITEKNKETLLLSPDYKQALQLSIYQYAMNHIAEFSEEAISCGIWSFAEVSRGVQPLVIEGNLYEAMISISNIIKEILTPEIDFSERSQREF